MDSSSADGFLMWSTLHGYYGPMSDGSIGNLGGAVHAMSAKTAKNVAELHDLLLEFERRVKKYEEHGGIVHESSKASIVYCMLDETSAKTARDFNIGSNYLEMRKRIIRDGNEVREKAQSKKGPAPMDVDALKESGTPQPAAAPGP